MPGKICRECSFEESNGHAMTCSKRNALKNLEFHVESQDYFGTLATIISLARQTKRKVDPRVIDDLMFLQENYKIVKK